MIAKNAHISSTNAATSPNDHEVLAWVRQAVRESHKDEKALHDDAIAKLQREHKRLQDRIDVMYEDKLDGRIDADYFDRKAAESRSEQCRITRDVEAHRTAHQSYVEEGIKLLQLAQRAHQVFENQPPAEKRKMLDFVLSNCRWKDGQSAAEYRQPFDLIAAATEADRQARASGGSRSGDFGNWLGGRDSNPDTQIQSLPSYR